MSDIVLPEAKKDTLSQLQQPFDSLLKYVDCALAGVYVTGYIIVSFIYHASLGLNELNPFRPKVAAAGAYYFSSISSISGPVYGIPMRVKVNKSRSETPTLATKNRVYEIVVGGQFILLGYFGIISVPTSDGVMTAIPKNRLEFISLLDGRTDLIPLLHDVVVRKPIVLFQKFQTHWAFFTLCIALTVILVSQSFPSKERPTDDSLH